MPRWKALPDELDPQVKEFASQLRRLVDRGGLSVAALADRTGYSKTSWERYLNGRLLAPKGAVVALAEVTGTNPVHLTTMWELAERAWSRAEMRHDRTMEAVRISQARAALGDFGGDAPRAEANGSKPPRESGGAAAGPGTAGPADGPPRVPAQPTASDADAREDEPASGSDSGAHTDSGSGAQSSTGGNSWNVAGYRGPSRTGGRASGAGATAPSVPSQADAAGPAPGTPGPYPPGPSGPYGGPPQAPAPAPATAPAPGGGRRQQLTMFLAGLVGALVVIGAVLYFTDGNGGGKDGAGKSPSPSATAPLNLPPGVKCSGDGCTGKDAERMGCSGELVTTARSVTVGGTFLEIRYSKTCGAAWARITRAVPGDEVEVTVGSHKATGGITKDGESIAYTPMVAVRDAAQVTACATLASGQQGCTK
ncbi:DUF2690 domain-containing protein [Streptomyces kebangsaanensis]|uniref:DUF2690 domain-containing protein n=1 Tax=Streptomyces kebangsaanensis TaxID=864058 RepID=A0ABW6KU32_9ACTN